MVRYGHKRRRLRWQVLCAAWFVGLLCGHGFGIATIAAEKRAAGETAAEKRKVDEKEKPAKSLLTKNQLSALTDEVLPAARIGNPLKLLQALSPLVAKLDDARLDEVNRVLAEHSQPSVDRLLADARLSLAQQNLVKDLPKPSLRELILTVRALRQQIDEVLAHRGTHAAFREPLPQPPGLTEYKDLFWEIHVWQNQLSAAISVAQYGVELMKQPVRATSKPATDDQELFNTDFVAWHAELAKTVRELNERELELRLNRLDFAVGVLKESKDMRERFLAAYAVDFDGQSLTEILARVDQTVAANEAQLKKAAVREAAKKSNARKPAYADVAKSVESKDKDKDKADTPTKAAGESAEKPVAPVRSTFFARERLNDPALSGYVRGQVQRGRELAGDLIVKSRSLFAGMHWWMRGRYGRGPEFGGLLKSEAALRSSAAMIGLFMPRQPPKPSDPSQAGYSFPDFLRRHHFQWAYQDRGFSDQNFYNVNHSQSLLGTGTSSKTNFFY